MSFKVVWFSEDGTSYASQFWGTPTVAQAREYIESARALHPDHPIPFVFTDALVGGTVAYGGVPDDCANFEGLTIPEVSSALRDIYKCMNPDADDLDDNALDIAYSDLRGHTSVIVPNELATELYLTVKLLPIGCGYTVNDPSEGYTTLSFGTRNDLDALTTYLRNVRMEN